MSLIQSQLLTVSTAELEMPEMNKIYPCLNLGICLFLLSK